MAKRAVLTGVTGQDGAYLASLLLEKGYEVWGACRRTSTRNLWRLDELGVGPQKAFHLVDYDLTDQGSALDLLAEAKPDEIYNLAAQSFVATSFAQPVTTAQITGVGALHLLEAMRRVCPEARFYQASTSEMFGKVRETPQSELTPFHPRSPYGVAKLFAHWATVNYRESYNLFATSGILFNHESPLRGLEFVTRKITDGVARIHLGLQECIELGNMDAKRDWGYAADYVDGMWRMLQAEHADTYVLATNRTVTVRDFVGLAFAVAGLQISWQGSGVDERGFDQDGRCVVHVNPAFFRPAEVDLLIGDADKARRNLGWEASTPLESLCQMMVEADIGRCQRQRA